MYCTDKNLNHVGFCVTPIVIDSNIKDTSTQISLFFSFYTRLLT